MSALASRPRRRSAARGFTVALVGPDGAGKSSLAARLPAVLEMPTRTVYMGINLEASDLLLPTTRLVLEVKRWLGRRPDMAPSGGTDADGHATPRTARGSAKTWVRTLNLIAEEWFRQAIISWHTRHAVVVLDRHFLFDFHSHDVAPAGRIPRVRRFHGYLLRRWYPRPELLIVLDAPGAALWARKQDGTVELLEQKRREYLALRREVACSAVVDVTRPLEDVLDEVACVIRDHHRERTGRAA